MRYLISFIVLVLISGTARAELYDTFMNPIKAKAEVKAESIAECSSGTCKLVEKAEKPKQASEKMWGIVRWQRVGLFGSKPIYGWVQKSGTTKTTKVRTVRTGRT